MHGKNLREFARVSGDASFASPRLYALLEITTKALTNISDAQEAVLHIRHHLIESGFCYGNKMLLQGMVGQWQGNCLGISLLLGALLKDHGFECSFEVFTRPMDAIDAEDQRLFGELVRGEHFTYDRPLLPRLSLKPLQPMYRFVPVEHPVLMVQGRRFETTCLEDINDDPFWVPKAERVQPVAFEALLGVVYIDRAQTMFGRAAPERIRALIARGLERWPQNREGWLLLWKVACETGDAALQRDAAERYACFAGDDSRFYHGMYLITGDIAWLDAALAKFPASVLSFVERHVVHGGDERETRFNLAVAAWCVANSNILDLGRFYGEYRSVTGRLFGPKHLRDVLN